MKETWNVVIAFDGFTGNGTEMVFIGETKDIQEYCDYYAEEHGCDCWIAESFEVERD